jgi:hypothetical protein
MIIVRAATAVIIEKKKRQGGGGRLMNVPDIDVVREILNVDMPKQK